MSADPVVTAVVCPRCRKSSTDTCFCEHCQFEIPATSDSSSGNSLSTPTQVGDVRKNLEWTSTSIGISWPEDPFPSFTAEFDRLTLRVHGIRPDLWRNLESSVVERQNITLPVLPPVHVTRINGGALVGAEVWSDSKPFTIVDASQSTEELVEATMAHCRLLNQVMSALHGQGLVWLEFDPLAMETHQKQIRITNLDWRVFPFGQLPSQFARISPQYSAPETCRFRDDLIGPKTDVYHLALFVYYRLAGLWPYGFSGRGPEQFAFEIPPLRIYRPDLPTGIWPILRRGLSLNVTSRPGTTGEFLHEIDLARNRRRLTHVDSESVATPTTSAETSVPDQPFLNSYDVGWNTTVGRAKQAIGAINQDRVVVFSESVGDRTVWLAVVADGVSYAQVGTGERASEIACTILEDSIRVGVQSTGSGLAVDWSTIICDACRAASEAIVKNALGLADPQTKINDNDLMSTTALIGIIDGDRLILANVGDSRGYLVSNGTVEQLTVDGDVATTLLLQGSAPEQVRELGNSGKALKYCLGAAKEIDDGELIVDHERARPTISTWDLQSGDTIILCSDGLVEERVFLEPEDLVSIASTNPGISAQELADKLIAAADVKQRLPTASEPKGFGDNISCVVIQIERSATT